MSAQIFAKVADTGYVIFFIQTVFLRVILHKTSIITLEILHNHNTPFGRDPTLLRTSIVILRSPRVVCINGMGGKSVQNRVCEPTWFRCLKCRPPCLLHLPHNTFTHSLPCAPRLHSTGCLSPPPVRASAIRAESPMRPARGSRRMIALAALTVPPT